MQITPTLLFLVAVLSPVVGCSDNVVHVYNKLSPPPEVVNIDANTESLRVEGVYLPSRTLSITVSSLWYDDTQVPYHQRSALDVNITDSVFASLSFVSMRNVSHSEDACDQLSVQRPAAHWRLRRLRIFVLRLAANARSADAYHISNLSLCNASLMFTSLRQSSLRVSNTAFSNSSLVINGNTHTFRLRLEAPLSLERSSLLTAEYVTHFKWHTTATSAPQLLSARGKSVVRIRQCSLISDDIPNMDAVSVVLEGSSQLLVIDNTCGGAASPCAGAFLFDKVVVASGSLLSLSSNVFNAVGFRDGVAASAALMVSWSAITVGASSTLAVIKNTLSTESRGLFLSTGTSQLPADAVAVSGGGLLLVVENHVTVKRPDPDTSFVRDAAPIEFTFNCLSVCLYATGLLSTIRIASNSLSFAEVGENVTLALTQLQRTSITAAGSSGSAGIAMLCDESGQIFLNGGSRLAMEPMPIGPGVSISLQRFMATSIQGRVVVDSSGACMLGGGVVAVSDRVSGLQHRDGVCGSVEFLHHVSVRDFGVLHVGNHDCKLQGLGSMSGTQRSMLLVSVTSEFNVSSMGRFVVENNTASLQHSCGADGCTGVLLQFTSSSNIHMESGGALMVLRNAVLSMPSALSALAFQIDTTAVVIDGAALEVKDNSVTNVQCVPRNGVVCAGIFVFLQAQLLLTSGAMVSLANNAVDMLLASANPILRFDVVGIAIHNGGLQGESGSFVSLVFNRIHVRPATYVNATGVCAGVVSLVNRSRLLLRSNDILISNAGDSYPTQLSFYDAIGIRIRLEEVTQSSSVIVLLTSIFINSTRTHGSGIDCYIAAGFFASSDVIISNNKINVSTLLGGVGVRVGGEALTLSQSSKLHVVDNRLHLSGVEVSGVHFALTTESSTTEAPAALTITSGSWVAVSGNTIAVLAPTFQPQGLVKHYGVLLEASNHYGLAVLVRNSSLLAVDENNVLSPCGCGVVLIFDALYFWLPWSEPAPPADFADPLWRATSTVITEHSLLFISRNSVNSSSEAVHVMFSVAYSVFVFSTQGSVPKGFLLANNAKFTFSDNYITSDSGPGIGIRCRLKPVGDYTTTSPVASAYLVDQSIISFTYNHIKTQSLPIRWHTESGSTFQAYYFSGDCLETQCSSDGETGSEICKLVRVECHSVRRVYIPSSSIVNASMLLIENNLLVTTSVGPSIAIDRSNGRSHVATFLNGAVLSISRNVIISRRESESAVALFLCLPSFIVTSEQPCVQMLDDRSDESLYNIPPMIRFLDCSTFVMQANGIWGTANGVHIEASLKAGQDSTISVANNKIYSSSTCFVFHGDLRVDSRATWSFEGNRCDSLRLATISSLESGLVMFQCNVHRGSDTSTMNAFRSAVDFGSYGLDLRSCSDASYTTTNSQLRTSSVSLLPTTSVTNRSSFSEIDSTDSEHVTLSATASGFFTESASVSKSLSVERATLSLAASYTLMLKHTVTVPLQESLSRDASISSSVLQSNSPRVSLSLPLNSSTNSLTDSLPFCSHSASATQACLVAESITRASPFFDDVLVTNEGMVGNSEPSGLSVSTVIHQHLSDLRPSSAAAIAVLDTLHRDGALDGAPVSVHFSQMELVISGKLQAQQTNVSVFRVSIVDPRPISIALGEVASIFATVGVLAASRYQLCDPTAQAMPVLLFSAHLGTPPTALQVALRKSIESAFTGSIVTSVFTGDVSNDLPALALTALMACAPLGTAASSGFGSLNVLAPLLLYNTYTAVLYSNVLLLACVALLLVVAVLGSYSCLLHRPESLLSRWLLQKLRFQHHRRTTGEYWVKSSYFAVERESACVATVQSSSSEERSWMKNSFRPLLVSICENILDGTESDVPTKHSSKEMTHVVCLYDLYLLVKCPAFLLSAALSLYPGTLFAAIRLTQLYQAAPRLKGAPSAFDVSVGGLIVGAVFAVFLLPLPGLLYWVATRRIECSFHRHLVPLGESKDALLMNYRIFSWCRYLEPYGRLLPSDASKLWGPLVGSSSGHWFWVLTSVFSGWLMCVACLLQFHGERMYCTVNFSLLAVAHVALAIGTLVSQPKRSAALNGLSAVSLLVSAAVLGFSALTVYSRQLQIDDVTAVCLGMVQVVATLLKSAAGALAAFAEKLHQKRHGRMSLVWSSSKLLSAEAKMAEAKSVRLEKRRSAFQLHCIELFGPDGGSREERSQLRELITGSNDDLWGQFETRSDDASPAADSIRSSREMISSAEHLGDSVGDLWAALMNDDGAQEAAVADAALLRLQCADASASALTCGTDGEEETGSEAKRCSVMIDYSLPLIKEERYNDDETDFVYTFV